MVSFLFRRVMLRGEVEVAVRPIPRRREQAKHTEFDHFFLFPLFFAMGRSAFRHRGISHNCNIEENHRMEEKKEVIRLMSTL